MPEDCIPTISVIIPTWNGEKEMKEILPLLLSSTIKVEILIIDSSSEDDTVNVAKSFGVKTKVIPKNTFNHGLTREMGRKLLSSEIVVYLTQDAFPTDPKMLEKLILPIVEKKAVVTYGRHIPKSTAHPFEKISRGINYPAKSEIRSLEDVETRGHLAFFCSNSCAAYLNQALDEIGGFPKTSFGEDGIAVAKLLEKGGSIAYVAEAEVIHSHSIQLLSEFKRYRMIGKKRREFPEYFGKGNKRIGWLFVKEFLKKCPLVYFPYAFIYLGVRSIGFFTSFL